MCVCGLKQSRPLANSILAHPARPGFLFESGRFSRSNHRRDYRDAGFDWSPVHSRPLSLSLSLSLPVTRLSFFFFLFSPPLPSFELQLRQAWLVSHPFDSPFPQRRNGLNSYTRTPSSLLVGPAKSFKLRSANTNSRVRWLGCARNSPPRYQ